MQKKHSCKEKHLRRYKGMIRNAAGPFVFCRKCGQVFILKDKLVPFQFGVGFVETNALEISDSYTKELKDKFRNKVNGDLKKMKDHSVDILEKV